MKLGEKSVISCTKTVSLAQKLCKTDGHVKSNSTNLSQILSKGLLLFIINGKSPSAKC